MVNYADGDDSDPTMIDPTYRDDDHDVPRSFSGFLIIMMIFRSRSESLGHRASDGATGTGRSLSLSAP